jgi:hypothetical protein
MAARCQGKYLTPVVSSFLLLGCVIYTKQNPIIILHLSSTRMPKELEVAETAKQSTPTIRQQSRPWSQGKFLSLFFPQ